jgi:hypothetical protein
MLPEINGLKKTLFQAFCLPRISLNMGDRTVYCSMEMVPKYAWPPLAAKNKTTMAVFSVNVPVMSVVNENVMVGYVIFSGRKNALDAAGNRLTLEDLDVFGYDEEERSYLPVLYDEVEASASATMEVWLLKQLTELPQFNYERPSMGIMEFIKTYLPGDKK